VRELAEACPRRLLRWLRGGRRCWCDPRARRPAGSGLLDENTTVVGIPAFLPIDPGATAGFYFVTAREAAPASSGSEPRSGSGAQQSAGSAGSAGSRRGRAAPGAAPIEGLQLGAPLGKGGYGVVYRGLYQGKLVAVKVRPWLGLVSGYFTLTRGYTKGLPACSTPGFGSTRPGARQGPWQPRRARSGAWRFFWGARVTAAHAPAPRSHHSHHDLSPCACGKAQEMRSKLGRWSLRGQRERRRAALLILR